jgi:hypothetical protein
MTNPPLGPEQGWNITTCERDTSDGQFPLGEQLCGKPAAWHIIWDTTQENSVACDQHATEALHPWHALQIHPLQPDCTMPGSVWIEQERRCVWDGNAVPITAALQQVEPVG